MSIDAATMIKKFRVLGLKLVWATKISDIRNLIITEKILFYLI